MRKCCWAKLRLRSRSANSPPFLKTIGRSRLHFSAARSAKFEDITMKSSLKMFVGLIVGTLLTQSALAQVAEKKTLTLDGAKRVMATAMAEAKRSGGTGVIAIVDDGGNTIALERLDNTFAAGANI